MQVEINWQGFNNHERKIVNLLLQGWGPTAIAKHISDGNSRNILSTRIRASSLRHRLKIHKYNQEPPTPILEIIPKRDLPDWYEIGWNVIAFNEDQCTVKWHSDRDPKKPNGGQNASDACGYTVQRTDLHGEGCYQF